MNNIKMSNKYLELSPDEMVELLASFQKIMRQVIKSASDRPYSEKAHQKACAGYYEKGKWLAAQGDVI